MARVGTWGTAMYHGDDSGDEGRALALRVSKTVAGSTLRQIIRTSIGGDKLRLTFSNEYGQTNLNLNAVHIAKATVTAESDIDTSTDTVVTFGGETGATIKPGERVVSDAIDFKTVALQRIAVSVFFGDVPERLACHVGARANSFVKPGNCVSAERLADAEVNTHWYALSNVDVKITPRRRTHKFVNGAYPLWKRGLFSIVVLGDSITDGYGVTDEQYTRWTDILAERLQEDPDTKHISVINMGIGTNKLQGQTNPAAAIDRFERDVLNQPGIGCFIFLIGVNDLLEPITKAEDIINGYKQMMSRAQQKGIKAIGCTIAPYGHKDPRRHLINKWLRGQYKKSVADGEQSVTDGEQNKIDGLLDFDELLADPACPERMKPEYDNDGLHPNIRAYRAMGEYAYNIIKN